MVKRLIENIMSIYENKVYILIYIVSLILKYFIVSIIINSLINVTL